MDQLQIIQNRIYEFRGQKVMLDCDLAEMYGVQTKEPLNQAVKRNIERFPSDVMFQISLSEETQDWRSQFVTSCYAKNGEVRPNPYVFTELGVAMLSSVLYSKSFYFLIVYQTVISVCKFAVFFVFGRLYK